MSPISRPRDDGPWSVLATVGAMCATCDHEAAWHETHRMPARCGLPDCGCTQFVPAYPPCTDTPLRDYRPSLWDAWQRALADPEPTPVYDAMLAEGWQR